MNVRDYTFYQADGYPIDESTISDRPALVIVSDGNGGYGITEVLD